MTYRTDWRNIGAWVDWKVYPFIGIKTPWGNLIFKRWADRLFSDRAGFTPNWRIGSVCVKWVRLRTF